MNSFNFVFYSLIPLYKEEISERNQLAWTKIPFCHLVLKTQRGQKDNIIVSRQEAAVFTNDNRHAYEVLLGKRFLSFYLPFVTYEQ
jgi:hypothetical protein